MLDWEQYVRDHLPALGLRPERESEIVRELAQQLEASYAESLSAGKSDEQASAEAASVFPDWRILARQISESESTAVSRWWQGLIPDLRHAFRLLIKRPAFTAVATLTLAFGIGANTAAFSVVDALLLRPVPYKDSGRIVVIETRKPAQPENAPWISVDDFRDFRQRATSFSRVAAISAIWNLSLTGRGPAENVESLFVSSDFFPLLGITPHLGRLADPGDDRPGAASRVALVSYGFWQRRLGGDDRALGAGLTIEGHPITVIGVLPADFHYVGEPLAGTASQIDLWLPFGLNPIATAPRGVRFLKVIARLRDGVSVGQADKEARAIGQGLAEAYPDSNRGYEMGAASLESQLTQPLKPALVTILVAVGFVLLIACANVANLVLARDSERLREMSIRSALGATQSRLVRQLLAEGCVLSTVGGLAGAGVAWLLLRLVTASAPAGLLAGRKLGLNLDAALVAGAVVILSAILSSLPPALRLLRRQLAPVLSEAGRGVASDGGRFGRFLIVGETAAALVLLVGAALLIRSFTRLLRIDPGFDSGNVATLSIQMPASAGSREQRAATMRMVEERLRSAPGVASVAGVSRLPMSGSNLTARFSIEGRDSGSDERNEVEYRVAGRDYFRTMGIPLRRGRFFEDQDDRNPAAALVINEAMARRFWPNEDAVGKRIRFNGASPWSTIVGVAGDVRHFGLELDAQPEVYRPYAVNPLTAPILVVRGAGDRLPDLSALSALIRSVSPEIPIYNVSGMRRLVDRSTAERRFIMSLLSGFALAAILLASIGIYGVMSQAVARRTREIGLRMAIGAPVWKVLVMVLGSGLRLALTGAVIGGLAAAALTRLMRKMLFGVDPLDAGAFAAAVAALVLVAAVACYLPARRATRIDPIRALRQE